MQTELCYMLNFMLHESTYMPVGKSGRIVIEIDPNLKQELYESLNRDDSSLKKWFLDHVDNYLSGRAQFAIDFELEKDLSSEGLNR